VKGAVTPTNFSPPSRRGRRGNERVHSYCFKREALDDAGVEAVVHLLHSVCGPLLQETCRVGILDIRRSILKTPDPSRPQAAAHLAALAEEWLELAGPR
jgi:hypothetical protein